MIHSYPKVFNIGHPQLVGLFEDPVVVEEKIDGSQFSAAVIDGELQCRSKGTEQRIDAPDKMFLEAVESIKTVQHLMTEQWVYRFEYLRTPKHNVLAYDRIPNQHLILFDVETSPHTFLSPDGRANEACRLHNLDCIPVLFEGKVESVDQLIALLDTESCLGGVKVEGIVAKNYQRFTRDGKVMMGKHVSEAFKEVHNKEWKKANPSGKDILGLLSERIRTEARWSKAIQRLGERNELEGSPRDIGKLIKAIQDDVHEECEELIKEALWKWAWPHLSRKCVGGFAEFYKQRLLDQQFEEEGAPDAVHPTEST